MNLHQAQSDALNLRHRAQDDRQRAASELQKFEQYKSAGDATHAHNAQTAADRLNNEADQLDAQAIRLDQDANNIEREVNKLESEIHHLQQEISKKHNEIDHLTGKKGGLNLI